MIIYTVQIIVLHKFCCSDSRRISRLVKVSDRTDVMSSMCSSAFRCFVFMFSRNGGHQWPSGMSKHLKPRIPNKRFRRSALMKQQLFGSKTEIFDFRPDTIDRHPTHIFLFQNIEFPERCAIWNSPRTPTTPISSFTRLNETPTLQLISDTLPSILHLQT